MNTQERLTKKAIVSIVLMLSLFGLINPATAVAADTGQQKMYRMYNCISSEHLYTADTNERDTLRKGDWIYEGVAWIAPTKSSTPVIRLYNPGLGDHHYTTDQNEVKVLTSKHGWKNEGVGWYSSDSHKITVYRQFNPGLRTGAHNYTTDQNEYDVNNTRNGWRGEGVAWYALDKGWQEADGLVGNALEAKLDQMLLAAQYDPMSLDVEKAKMYMQRLYASKYKVYGNPKVVSRSGDVSVRALGEYQYLGDASFATNQTYWYKSQAEADKALEFSKIHNAEIVAKGQIISTASMYQAMH